MRHAGQQEVTVGSNLLGAMEHHLLRIKAWTSWRVFEIKTAVFIEITLLFLLISSMAALRHTAT